MPQCKRCGSSQTVKSGRVRGKQRYLCKQCRCHFVEGDLRENRTAFLFKTLCRLFQALGVKQYGTVGQYLNRDSALVCRWMNEKSFDYDRHWNECTHELGDIRQVFEKIKEGGVDGGGPILMADNVVDGMYVAVIVQPRGER